MKHKSYLFILFILLAVGTGGVLQSSAQTIQPPTGPDSCPADLDAEVDAAVADFMQSRNNQIPGMTIAITRDGEMLCSKAYGFRDFENQTPMRIDSRSHIGSVTKVPAATALLHLLETDPAGINSHVYGPTGLLDSPDYDDAIIQGTRRHFPIVGMAIGANNRVITWYSDGKYTVGDSLNLDKHQTAQDFEFPNGQEAQDVIGIGRGGDDNFVYSYYRDGTYSVGTPSDLASVVQNRREDHSGDSDLDNFKSDGIHNIVGISIRPDGVIYAHYQNGTVTSGHIDEPWDLKSRWNGGFENYVVPVDQDRTYDIVGIARSINNESIAWFSDNLRSKGSVTDLGEDTGLEGYERRGVTGSRQEWIEAHESIQVRHLLSHSAGFTRSGNGDAAAEKYAAVSNFYNKETNPIPYSYINQHVLSTRPLLFKPGEEYSYSNHGMGLVGHLIEEMSGEDWYDYMLEHILVPAGADAIAPRGTLYADLMLDAKPHTLDDDGNFVTRDFPITNHSGSTAGSLKASAQDLALFMLATDRDNETHPDVLLDGTLWLMETRPFPDTVDNRALGWGVICRDDDDCSSNRKLWHNG
ncbi:MAG: serine hydrolase domain-containing protein, partial [Chloroflexota bacterium]